jgi:hypothetical protein
MEFSLIPSPDWKASPADDPSLSNTLVLRMPNKTSLRQLRVDLGHAVRSAPHRSFRFP